MKYSLNKIEHLTTLNQNFFFQIIPAIVFLVPLVVAQDKPVIPIITYNSEHNADGTYRFKYV